MKTPHKYELYVHAVQSPEADAKFYAQKFRQLRGRTAHDFREDFCGTFRLSAEWLRLHPKNRAMCLDIDSDPLQWGRKHHVPLLTPDQRSRLWIRKRNVISVTSPKVDIAIACNFSYCTIKDRKTLVRYFRSCYQSLRRDGIFMVDTSGGSETYEPNLEKIPIHTGNGNRFSYLWEQIFYDPVTNEAQFYIHFKFPNGRMLKKAFFYDWRIWTIPEIRECMEEAGFRKTLVYWEQDDDRGGGNGVFRQTEREDNCDVWIAYVFGLK